MNKLVLLILLCLNGCCGLRSYDHLLDQAESIIELKPDSAYNILSSIKYENVKHRNQRARYALLYTKALDKQQVHIDNDSLISVALKYYNDHGSDYHLASALFYSARIDFNRDNIHEAVKKLTHAEQIAPHDSLYLNGLICGAIGLCYAAQLDHHNAIMSYEKEYDIFYQLGIKHNQASSLLNQSKQYGLLTDYNRAIELNHASKDIYIELQDSVNMLSCDLSIARWRMRNNENVSDIRRSFFIARSTYKNYPKTEREYSLLAELYGRGNMLDSAIYYMERSIVSSDTTTTRGKVIYNHEAARIAALKGQKNRAIKLLQNAYNYAEQDYCESLENSVQELKERYKSELYKEKTLKLKAQRDDVIIIIITLIIITLLSVYLLIIHYRGKLRKLDEDLGLAQDLVQAVTNSMSMINNTNERVNSDLNNVNFMMTKLNKLIERMPRYEREPHKFISEFVGAMYIREHNKRSKTIFYDIIDGDFVGVLDNIRHKYELDNYEIEIICMLALGVSNNAIRIIMNHKNNRTIYNYRSSIKQKLCIDIDSKSILDLLCGEKNLSVTSKI